MPSWYSECAKLTTSDSVVDREVDVCLFEIHASGKNVLGPFSVRNPPEVDLTSPESPPKSASTYSSSLRSLGSSWQEAVNL